MGLMPASVEACTKEHSLAQKKTCGLTAGMPATYVYRLINNHPTPSTWFHELRSVSHFRTRISWQCQVGAGLFGNWKQIARKRAAVARKHFWEGPAIQP